MLLRRIAVENVRSFLDRTELILDGPISILIGPNGGGKTNLLDTAVILLRRYLLASMYPMHTPTAEAPDRYQFRHNDALNHMHLERHSNGAGKPQLVEVEIEVTQLDCDNMVRMKADATELCNRARSKYDNIQLQNSANWHEDYFKAGTRHTYKWDGHLQPQSEAAGEFQQYLNYFEIDSMLREEFAISGLSTPMLYLPVNRALTNFQSSVELSNYNAYEQKRLNDAAISRNASSIVPLAVGRLAQKYRMLLEADNGKARTSFKDDENLKELTNSLSELGYEWDLECTAPLKNTYDVRLKKQGSSFLVGAASSGERELLTYVFAIFALNVRDALIVVDEPELHLHPKWQKSLLRLFTKLSNSTGNQFLLATHSPTFVSPDSIQYVSRVFSRDQRSQIVRLTPGTLPEAKHLLNIVNSQNNERIFFADEVVLVEGLSDRIFFESVLDYLGRGTSYYPTLEVVSVGGKGLFSAYGKLLTACKVPFSIIADRDYIEEVGTDEVKKLFKQDDAEIKRDVIDNIKSLDGEALVSRIEEAFSSGSWGDASDTWAYIKTRRKVLRANLTNDEKATLNAFIEAERGNHRHLLKDGDLEAYLPEGYRSKDLAKLITFLASGDFWSKLSEPARKELTDIGNALMPSRAETPPETVPAEGEIVAAPAEACLSDK